MSRGKPCPSSEGPGYINYPVRAQALCGRTLGATLEGLLPSRHHPRSTISHWYKVISVQEQSSITDAWLSIHVSSVTFSRWTRTIYTEQQWRHGWGLGQQALLGLECSRSTDVSFTVWLWGSETVPRKWGPSLLGKKYIYIHTSWQTCLVIQWTMVAAKFKFPVHFAQRNRRLVRYSCVLLQRVDNRPLFTPHSNNQFIQHVRGATLSKVLEVYTQASFAERRENKEQRRKFFYSFLVLSMSDEKFSFLSSFTRDMWSFKFLEIPTICWTQMNRGFQSQRAGFLAV